MLGWSMIWSGCGKQKIRRPFDLWPPCAMRRALAKGVLSRLKTLAVGRWARAKMSPEVVPHRCQRAEPARNSDVFQRRTAIAFEQFPRVAQPLQCNPFAGRQACSRLKSALESPVAHPSVAG
jgi:hypothetical protein